MAAQIREYLFTPSTLKLDKFFRGRAVLGRATRRLHGVEEGNLSAYRVGELAPNGCRPHSGSAPVNGNEDPTKDHGDLTDLRRTASGA